MNFLSKTFSSFTGTSIPYTTKEKIIDPSAPGSINSRAIWTVYNGTNPKNDNAAVTIFEFNLKDPVNIQRGHDLLARNAFKKLKLIKLPGIITIIDFIETETQLYIITEPVLPLITYLGNHSDGISRDAKLYGIYNLAHTLLFINMKANCLHGNINLFNSIYVNQLGDWKVFGFELLTNLTSDPEQPIYRFSRALPGFDTSTDMDAVRQFPIKLDSYLFGLFIYQVLGTTDFNLSSLESADLTKVNTQKVPSFLLSSLKKLTNPNPSSRITIEKFVQETESNFTRNNMIISFNQQLEEIKFKNDSEKLEFFKFELSNFIPESTGLENGNIYPNGFLDFKLLPELTLQFNNLTKAKLQTPLSSLSPLDIQQRQETMSIILNYILKFGVNLSSSQFDKMVKPIILETFSLNDRSIRLVLLNHLPNFEVFLTESEVQLKIFYSLITGFQDTNFMIRETTLKSITIIIDKVSVKQVNQDLLKILAKSQVDPKPSIRVNTLVLIIKISGKIYKASKNSVLITALAKSLRDTFTPCKMTALSGFESLIEEFTLEEICSKVLGHLAISLMDKKSLKVRKRAKDIFQLYLDSVERHAKTLPETEDNDDSEELEFFEKYGPVEAKPAVDGQEPTNTGLSDAGTFSFGWNLMSKLSTSAVEGQLNNDFNSSTPDLTRIGTPSSEPLQATLNKKETLWVNDDQALEDDGWDLEDDGWGANDDPIVEDTKKISLDTPIKQPSKMLTTANKAKKTTGLKLGAKPTRKPGSTLKLNLTVEDNDDDSWGDQW
ncbi:ARM repeat-containing protein [Suhomyces tanzawaensis NRRL Y-17324]|uniref:ARM repeat-containing protein n=1 Tax=Suhomyces tanzawaensis NRRL Y-17324 TaxID=984487 RepID=A0A1E4SIR8_9ASCO|nr:ARM repeat-containing protein [Suhomyces tanzawaensis NRRL Y-17324]ODV79406.1 ARM repeat-containing protein [Suhomyces tanzawaensis NRRL Y-17324]